MVEVQTVRATTEVIKAALEQNPKFFFNFFMGEELECAVPQFHIDTFQLMTDLNHTRVAIAMPRGHAKTMIAKLATVWHILFTDYSYVAYVGSAVKHAAQQLEAIIDMFKTPNFESVFGHVVFESEQISGFYKFTIGEKQCILQAFGIDSKLRGTNVKNKRPQLAIVDDLESMEELETSSFYERTTRWFHGTFLKALDPRINRVVQIGNLLLDRSVLADNLTSPKWTSIVYGALLSDGSSLWEEVFPKSKLLDEYKEYCRIGLGNTWLAEMMNIPMSNSATIVDITKIKRHDGLTPEDIEYGCITVDPAISDKRWAHKACIAVHGWANDRWNNVEYYAGTGIDPYQLCSKILDLAAKWRINVIGIETVAYQAALLSVIERVALEKGYNLERDFTVVELRAATTKAARIISWCSMLMAGDYALMPYDLECTQELSAYKPGSKTNQDDIIDAMAYILTMQREFLQQIISTRYSLPVVIECIPIARIINEEAER
jgi:hypothetical protein